MTIQIANGESGASVRSKLNTLLGEHVNVKHPDFGAVGDGVHDDTPNIQAAINYVLANGGGTVFFPQGKYLLTVAGGAPLNALTTPGSEIRIGLVGLGGYGPNNTGSVLFGNYNGYLVDTTNASNNGQIEYIHRLAFWNQHATGKCLLVANFSSMEVSSCSFVGFYGAIGGDSTYYPNFTSCLFVSGRSPGSIGFGIGGGTLHSCNFQGWDNAVRCYSPTMTITGSRFEVNNTAIQIGTDLTGASKAVHGGIFSSCQFEKNRTGISIDTADGLTISNNDINGRTGPNAKEGFNVTTNTAAGANSLVVANLVGAGLGAPVIGDFIGVLDDQGLKIPQGVTISNITGTAPATLSLTGGVTTATIFTTDDIVCAATQNDLWSGTGIIVTNSLDDSLITANTISIRGNVGGIKLASAFRTTIAANNVTRNDIVNGADYILPSDSAAGGNQQQLHFDIASAGGTNSNSAPLNPTVDGRDFKPLITGTATGGNPSLVTIYKYVDLNNNTGSPGIFIIEDDGWGGITYPIGWTVEIRLVSTMASAISPRSVANGGSGTTVISTRDGSVTGVPAGSAALTFRAKNSVAWIRKTAANTWYAWGDLIGTSTFATLPASPFEGQTVDITDCNTSTFLATAAAGGVGATAHRRVRYNAAAAVWQVIG